MNEQQKRILKTLWNTFDAAHAALMQYAYSISDEVGYACDQISIDRILDIEDNLKDLGVLEPVNYDED